MTNAVRIIQGDNLEAMQTLRETHAGKIEMIYMDPPFNTGKRQTGGIGFGGMTALMYEDPLQDVCEFAGNLAHLAKSAWQLLTPTGCLVVHLDWRTVHYVKCQLDHCCGTENFASEIIWSYRRMPTKTPNFQRTHDTLLRYVKTPGQSTWNQLYTELAPSTVATWGMKRQQAIVVNGKRTRSSTTEAESPGAPMGDVWQISIVAPVAKERTAYPTQKPEALLERIIRATTNEGDTVLDPFCGSGTSVAVANRLGRRAIGIDQNPDAIAVTRKRLGMEEP